MTVAQEILAVHLPPFTSTNLSLNFIVHDEELLMISEVKVLPHVGVAGGPSPPAYKCPSKWSQAGCNLGVIENTGGLVVVACKSHASQALPVGLDANA